MHKSPNFEKGKETDHEQSKTPSLRRLPSPHLLLYARIDCCLCGLAVYAVGHKGRNSCAFEFASRF